MCIDCKNLHWLFQISPLVVSLEIIQEGVHDSSQSMALSLLCRIALSKMAYRSVCGSNESSVSGKLSEELDIENNMDVHLCEEQEHTLLIQHNLHNPGK